MILKPGPGAPPHFFLISYRADPDEPATPQQVGTFVARSVTRFDGSPGTVGDVRQEDELFPGDGPVRYEAELAPWKPEPDVVVVDDDLADILDDPVELADAENVDIHITEEPFGTVAIDRGGGFDPAIPRNFGWFPKGKAPRLSLAGDVTNFDPVANADQKLPDGFDNSFHNGRALAGEACFSPGDRLRFTDLDGPVTIATVPAGPVLTVSMAGQLLDPPLDLDPKVDTVVMDRGTSEFTFVWRATFKWEKRFEGAELGIE